MMDRADGNAHVQQARYLRPDAGRYLRPDALRFIRPDVARLLPPGALNADHPSENSLKYRADQRRIPAGQSGGGRWTDMLVSLIFGLPQAAESADEDGDDEDDGSEDEDSGGDRNPLADADHVFRNAYASDIGSTDIDDSVTSSNTFDTLYDADNTPFLLVGGPNEFIVNEYGEPYYKVGGHHEMPQAVYEKWDLAPETRQVFDSSTTGGLPKGLVTGPDGESRGHYWDRQHRAYNDSVMDLSDRFLQDNNITDTRKMTPEQARDLLAEIRNSEEPKIKDYNRAMRYIGRIFRSGNGRGSQ